MSIFETNLAAVRLASPEMARRLEQQHAAQGEPTQLGGFAIEPARSGAATVRFMQDGADFYLHSPYDPLREAEQFAERALADAPRENLTVLFGLGLGYQALALAQRIPAGERIMVFEPHTDLLYLALCHVDLSPLLSRANLTLTSNTVVSNSLLSFMNMFEIAAFTGMRLVTNPVFERLPLAGGYKTIADRLRYEAMAVAGNVQTLMVMGEMQQMNILLNFPELLDNPPFRNLLDAFHGRPAVIVSAGPSLEKNMHLLHELDGRALIIAVDTATKPLQAAGITPHVVVTGDPQEANARHLWNVKPGPTYLIAEPQSPVSAVQRWPGRKFMCSFHDNMMKWLDEVLGDRGRVHVWGSVAVMAYSVAVKVGADPIVFIGQDLSFPGGRTYAAGTYFETEDKQEMTVERLRREGSQLIEMTDIYGETVLTNRQMYAYFNYLTDQFYSPEVEGRRIINATEGGILHGPKVTVMPLRECIDTCMRTPVDVWGLLDAAYAAGNPLNLTRVQAELERMLSELRAAQETCAKGVTAVERTVKALEAAGESATDQAAAREQFARMTGLREKILRRPELGRIVEMANHAGIFAFTQGLQHAVKDERAAGSEPDMLRHCYHYHTLYATTEAAIGRLIPLFEHCRDALAARLAAVRPAGAADRAPAQLAV
jgi:hypothetical protein